MIACADRKIPLPRAVDLTLAVCLHVSDAGPDLIEEIALFLYFHRLRPVSFQQGIFQHSMGAATLGHLDDPARTAGERSDPDR